MQRAAYIPLRWSNNTNVVSDRIVPGKNLVVGGLLDPAFTSIK